MFITISIPFISDWRILILQKELSSLLKMLQKSTWHFFSIFLLEGKLLGCVIWVRTITRNVSIRKVCLNCRVCKNLKIVEIAKKSESGRFGRWIEPCRFLIAFIWAPKSVRLSGQKRNKMYHLDSEKRRKTEVLRTGIDACSILNALNWAWKSIGLYSLDKNKADNTN